MGMSKAALMYLSRPRYLQKGGKREETNNPSNKKLSRLSLLVFVLCLPLLTPRPSSPKTLGGRQL